MCLGVECMTAMRVIIMMGEGVFCRIRAATGGSCGGHIKSWGGVENVLGSGHTVPPKHAAAVLRKLQDVLASLPPDVLNADMK